MARIVQPPAIDGKDGDLSLDVELREHIAAVGTEYDALPRFAARQLADARGVAVANLEQHHPAAVAPPRIANAEVRPVHRLDRDPAAIRRNRDAFGKCRHAERLDRAERPLRDVDERRGIGIAGEHADIARESANPTLPTTA